MAQGYTHGHGDWGWGHMLFGGIMMVLFWGGVIALIILLVRWLGSSHGQSFAGGNGQRSSARHILDERFARGEIDREEYEERRRALDQ
ncbi:hypothetical protein CVT23_07355 [Minwuia thermotolerans]|uniref:SHOCT domain-containing protein n=2 Tax=Minwuia thermotolerans TaxID=2056226 RepID=A0A2M9G3Q8_9PROT|nr:hypothetical protein CVT23_07355 [Minwuia thermotolerans]